ncbi:unnamed protein product [Gongylonema pulchrum]|uniref:Peptidase M12A domain-containing protein n=1 Tax=Gongylonema pulchrum TaxID=637853 RepID=A0A183DFL9_9BILA|nr:unnamed protein product [Gongylonema pulchrum]
MGSGTGPSFIDILMMNKYYNCLSANAQINLIVRMVDMLIRGTAIDVCARLDMVENTASKM